MAYAIQVMVINRATGKGLSGEKVKVYGGPEVKTNSSGQATLIANSSDIEVYVNGILAYKGSASNAAQQTIVYKKG